MAENKRTQQASLGCGTLILIALIVLIFSGRGTGDLEREVHRLQSEVGQLKTAVEDQTGAINLLQQQLEKQQGAAKDK